MKKIIPETEQISKHDRIYKDKVMTGLSSLHTRLDRKKISGPPTSQKRKVVCSTCNNEWMSQLEDEVESFLTPLIVGNPHPLDKRQQELLSNWTFLKTIIGEYSNLDRILIPPSERIGFKATRVIPDEWTIRVGHTDPPTWQFEHVQNNGLFEYGQKLTDNMMWQKTKGVTFVIGHLVIYIAKYPLKVFGFPPDQFRYKINPRSANKLIQIHPAI